MYFSSIIFIWYFLPVCLILNFVFEKLGGNKLSNMFLLIASLLFYAWGEPIYILLILISICINWLFGLAIDDAEKFKKHILITDIIINLGMLAYFKYMNLIADFISHILLRNISISKLPLPIGISFFTFQSMSYVIDVYKGNIGKRANPGFTYNVLGYNTHSITNIKSDYSSEIVYTSKDSDERKVFVLRDSFGLAMFEYIGSQFSQSCFLHINSYTDSAIVKEYHPDILVYETVERSVPNLLNFVYN